MSSESDVVLIHYQEKPSVYARIERIEPDVKKDWYQVTLLLLTIPAQLVTWILREEYINGVAFTMGGQSMRLEGVKRTAVEIKSEDSGPSPEKKDSGKPAKVIPFRSNED